MAWTKNMDRNNLPLHGHQWWVHLHYHFISILGWKKQIWKQIFWLSLIFYICNHIVVWFWSTWTGCLMGEMRLKDGLWEGTACALSTNTCSVHRARVELLQNKPRSKCLRVLLCSIKAFALQIWSYCTAFLANIGTAIFLAVICPG